MWGVGKVLWVFSTLYYTLYSIPLLYTLYSIVLSPKDIHFMLSYINKYIKINSKNRIKHDCETVCVNTTTFLVIKIYKNGNYSKNKRLNNYNTSCQTWKMQSHNFNKLFQISNEENLTYYSAPKAQGYVKCLYCKIRPKTFLCRIRGCRLLYYVHTYEI